MYNIASNFLLNCHCSCAEKANEFRDHNIWYIGVNISVYSRHLPVFFANFVHVQKHLAFLHVLPGCNGLTSGLLVAFPVSPAARCCVLRVK